jgi:hypothetical protein
VCKLHDGTLVVYLQHDATIVVYILYDGTIVVCQQPDDTIVVCLLYDGTIVVCIKTYADTDLVFSASSHRSSAPGDQGEQFPGDSPPGPGRGAAV